MEGRSEEENEELNGALTLGAGLFAKYMVTKGCHPL